MRRFITSGLCFGIILLSACTFSYPPPKPLPLSDGYQATTDSQIAIAVDASGAKYIARIECDVATGQMCRLIYEKNVNGIDKSYVYKSPNPGYTFRNPDVAVTDSGTAVVTWQNCPSGVSNSRGCVTLLMHSTDLNQVAGLDFPNYSLASSAPILASRGEEIYAVEEVAVGTQSSALRYCNVSDYAPSCYWASDQPGSDDGSLRTKPAAAVTSSGSLHVVWLYMKSSTIVGYYNDNHGALYGNMTKMLNLGAASDLQPVIAIESDDDYVYLATTLYGSSDTMTLYYCDPTNCSGAGGTKTVNQPAATELNFTSRPSMAAGSETAWVAFAASNTDQASQSKIYWFSYSAGNSSPTPSIVFSTTTEDDDEECDPVVAVVEDWPVVGWHICGSSSTRDDIYFYDYYNSTRVIHDVDYYEGRGGLDMASNGEYVAGVWNELQDDGRVATWLAFNSQMTYLPVIIR